MSEPRGRAPEADAGAEPAAHRAGFVALLGPPNAGKSTLLNRLLGEKLAIVTARPQTTRSRILGILTLAHAQLMLVDTPGLHEGGRRLNEVLNEAVGEAIKGCDVAILLVDRTSGWGDVHARLAGMLGQLGRPFVVAGTKLDLSARGGGPWPPLGLAAEVPVLEISGLTGEGVTALLECTIGLLPESPALYPDQELTDRPLRWLCSELVREAAFECLEQELPYRLAVEVVSFDESRPELVEIHANLLVERNSQKRIVVGRGGAMIKRIGTRARRPIERLVGRQVNLQLFVKVDPRWLESPQRMHELGYY